MAVERWNMLHPTETQKTSYVETCLSSRQGPVMPKSCSSSSAPAMTSRRIVPEPISCTRFAAPALPCLRRMYAEQEDVFYYITVMNENYEHPGMPEGAEVPGCS
jgi:pyruvate dehydrogenase complex dehydrogenase (E1) component